MHGTIGKKKRDAPREREQLRAMLLTSVKVMVYDDRCVELSELPKFIVADVAHGHVALRNAIVWIEKDNLTAARDVHGLVAPRGARFGAARNGIREVLRRVRENACSGNVGENAASYEWAQCAREPQIAGDNGGVLKVSVPPRHPFSVRGSGVPDYGEPRARAPAVADEVPKKAEFPKIPDVGEEAVLHAGTLSLQRRLLPGGYVPVSVVVGGQFGLEG